tara:strand:+ start:245 stop:460 length:216 start_codon:yes stop_codon:yes gene_type:complete
MLRRDSRRINIDPLKSCEECRMVWQTATTLVEPYKKGGFSYYQDFPHYGLKKQQCPRCKEAKYELYSYSST